VRVALPKALYLLRPPATDTVAAADCTGASKGTPGDAKCVTEILGGGTKMRKLGKFTSLYQGKLSALNRLNSRINKCVDVSCLKCSKTHLKASLIGKKTRTSIIKGEAQKGREGRSKGEWRLRHGCRGDGRPCDCMCCVCAPACVPRGSPLPRSPQCSVSNANNAI